MTNFLYGREKRREADILARELRRGAQLDLTTLFITRKADDEFAEIGKALLSDRAALLDDHIVIWHGYEFASNSKYFNQ